MKKNLNILFLIIISYGYGFAQNTKAIDSPNGTVISNSGGTDIPYSASILDVRSNNKGILLPRMSTTNRDAIVSPTAGLLLYNNTTNQFNYHDGTAWQQASFGNQWNVSGLNYYYNGGNVGIGDATPDYKLDVVGTTYTSDLIVNSSLSTYSMNSTYGDISYRLNLNNPTQSALLTLKGDEFSFGNWGQHIILENATNTNYGGILHDVDGMKFRNFGVTDNFYFRNSANNTVASIDPSGNTAIDGTLTVNNGKGVMYNSQGAGQLKYYTREFSVHAILAGHARSGEFTIGLGGGFSSTPAVFVGDIVSTGGTSGELYRVIVQVYGCTTTECKARLVNTSPNAVDYNITYNLIGIGL